MRRMRAARATSVVSSISFHGNSASRPASCLAQTSIAHARFFSSESFAFCAGTRTVAVANLISPASSGMHFNHTLNAAAEITLAMCQAWL